MKSLWIVSLVLLFPMVVLAEEAPADDKQAGAENLLKPTNDVESWIFELNDGGEGEMTADGEAIAFNTTKTTGTDWHVQAYQPGIELEDGKYYVVKFKIKSPDEITVLLVGQIHEEDWHEIGLHEEIQPTDEFEEYEYEFTADGTVEGNNRIGFVLGLGEGEVSVQDMTLTEK